MLATKHSHPHDERISFEPIHHKYTVDNQEINQSVTKLVHNFFPQFNADQTAKQLHKKHFSNAKSQYHNMSVDDILNKWEENRIDASTKGTQLHHNIELYYNEIETTDISIEYSYFKNFVDDHSNLIPYRTEWEVFIKEFNLAGSIDMVFQNNDNTLSIYDWKRSKEIKKNNVFEFGNLPLDHLPNCNF